ncbi:uncharacterized protein LOC125492259 [Beta vulgaris subsp. vulgaris]|uniref:uncharacterized protein LOC125492259 n=1 Tax=Beta vulgaris subsp. vulgaris TaxID=3555 RepID=UPI00254681B6|nr:uncharacterized protein LOC125492259 [Beta vulgaris subsp. vulgaris]
MRPKIYLFGDSITEESFSNGGWGASLANHFSRTADIVVRGYSGYNTRWAVKVLDKVFPAMDEAAPMAVTVFFGANDACLDDRYAAFQHVPLDEYKQNLRFIFSFLKSLSGGGIEHLTNLQDLHISHCDLLDLEEKENMPWKSLHSLSSLRLRYLPKLVNLPEGLQHVTTLRSLCIHSCKKLKTLCSLQSLTELVIHWCNKELRDRCREPDGEDWPKIRHISHLDIR